MADSHEVQVQGEGCQAGRCCARRLMVLAGAIVLVLLALVLAQQLIGRTEGAEKPPKPDPHAWQSLFDGKTLKGWKVPKFGGEGEVTVVDGAIHLAMGNDMTGVTWTGKVPKTDYEIALEAKRVSGNDFFGTTTFPVGDSPCTLVVGGWGGPVVGLSNVDFYDASDNATTRFLDFKTGTWYRVRIRVTGAKIEAWINNEKVVDQSVAGHRFSIRDEVDLCRPLGVSSWCTEAALRNIRIRQLTPEEVAQIAAEKSESTESIGAPPAGKKNAPQEKAKKH